MDPSDLNEGYQHCAVDARTPDLVRFPRFANAVPIKLTLGPGDALVVPRGWFHYVEAHGHVLSVKTNVKHALVHDVPKTMLSSRPTPRRQ